MKMVMDATDVQRVFKALPSRSLREVRTLIEESLIDTQRDMRRTINVGATGDSRRRIIYRMSPATLSGEVVPDFPHAEGLEKGTRPHWTSVKQGTSLRKWADFKGINPWAVQASIAKKGTKAHPYVGPVFRRARVTVPRNIERGFARFINEVDNGRI